MSGPLCEKFLGSELFFFGVGVGRVFLRCLAFVFALFFGFSLPKMSRKILLMSGLVFLGFLDWLSGVFSGRFVGP